MITEQDMKTVASYFDALQTWVFIRRSGQFPALTEAWDRQARLAYDRVPLHLKEMVRTPDEYGELRSRQQLQGSQQ